MTPWQTEEVNINSTMYIEFSCLSCHSHIFSLWCASAPQMRWNRRHRQRIHSFSIGFCLFLRVYCCHVERWRFVVLEQEPEETSVCAAYSAVGFAGTLGLRMAHCCNFPAQAAEKIMSLCWGHASFWLNDMACFVLFGFSKGKLTSPAKASKHGTGPLIKL